jgi:tetratricopeptide (TPR) repeat protein
MNKALSIVFFILMIGFLPCFCSAQSDVQKILERADKHINDAEKFYAEMKYQKAKESYQFAARLYRNNNLPEYYAICYNGIGNIYIDLSLFEKAKSKGFEHALQQLDETKKIDPDFVIDSSLIADAFEGLGRYYSSVSTTLKTEKGILTTVHYFKALEYHNKALAIRRKLFGEKHQKVALSYYFIGKCYRGFSRDESNQDHDLNPVQKEQEFLHLALNLQLKILGENHYQTANSYEALGNYYYEIEKDYYKGFDFQQKALVVRTKIFDANHPKIASSYIDMAIYYRVINMFDEELSFLEKALKIQLSILGDEHVEIAKSYFLLADRYRRANELNKALSYYEYALAVFNKLNHEQSAEVAEALLGIALVYRDMNEQALELAYLFKSCEIHKKVFSEKHFKTGIVFMELGQYYLKNQMYDSTLFYYNKAIDVWKRQLGNKHYFIADAYDKIADLYLDMNNREKEFYYLKLSLNLKTDQSFLNYYNKRVFKTSDSDLGNSYNNTEQNNKALAQQLYNSYFNLAQYYKRGKDYKLALRHLQLALGAVCSSVSSDIIDVYSNPTTKDLSRNILWLDALREKGDLLRELYKLEAHDKDLEISIATYFQAIDVIKSLRTNFTSDVSRQELVSRSMPVYEGAISALFLMYNKTRNIKFLNQAFNITEQSKGFVLLQALQNNMARGNANIPPELLQKEEKLRQNLAYYSNYKNKGAKDNQKFDKIYFQTRQSYDSLVSMLENNYPAYHKLKYATEVCSVNELQSLLELNKDLLLEYFVGDKYLYVFKIKKKRKSFFKFGFPGIMKA